MRHLPKILLALGTIISIALLALAFPSGSYLASRFAGKILAVGKGKISNPELFITSRIFEAGFLLGLAIVLLLACTYLFRRFKYAAGDEKLGIGDFAFSNRQNLPCESRRQIGT